MKNLKVILGFLGALIAVIISSGILGLYGFKSDSVAGVASLIGAIVFSVSLILLLDISFFEIPRIIGQAKTTLLKPGVYQIISLGIDGDNILLGIKEGGWYVSCVLNNIAEDVEIIYSEDRTLHIDEYPNSKKTTIYFPFSELNEAETDNPERGNVLPVVAVESEGE